MWEAAENSRSELSPIPEFDYYHVENDSDEELNTARLLAKLSNSDLAFEWSMLCQECTDCWSPNGEFKFFFILNQKTVSFLVDYNDVQL